MSQELLARAEALRAKFREYETTPRKPGQPGYGHHRDDTDASQVHLHPHLQRKVAPCHQKDDNGRPRPKCSDHLVPFYDYLDKEQVHFVGPDAEAALSALQGWAKQFALDVLPTMPGSIIRLCLKYIPKLKLETVEGHPRLTVPLGWWNDVVMALYESGHGLSGAPLVHDGHPDTP